jgi:hypothetical protein
LPYDFKPNFVKCQIALFSLLEVKHQHTAHLGFSHKTAKVSALVTNHREVLVLDFFSYSWGE